MAERPRFYDEFVMISWSGEPSTKAFNDPGNVVVARLGPGEKAPRLLSNPFRAGLGGWTRGDACAWLLQAVLDDRQIMVGFDFGFGMPWVDRKSYFPGHDPDPDDVVALWRAVAAAGIDEPDLLVAGIADDPLADWFKRSGSDGPRFQARWRTVEVQLPQDLKPESLFHMDEARTRASFSGMRMLRLVKTATGKGLAIWPMERPKRAQPTFVEVLPTIFWRQASVGKSEIGTVEGLNRGLKWFQCEGISAQDARGLDRRSCDAMVGAAAMRSLVKQTEAWMPRKLNEAVSRHEGWIFGVL